MKKEKPLVNKEFLLQKFEGKGGWTYAEIPEIPPSGKIPFGWVRVKGSIDDYELKQVKLMPMGNGNLFLPVKAAIRKVIKKEAGDFVRVLLYSAELSSEVPGEILACFENEPKIIYQTFLKFSEGEQKDYLNWIYDAKTEDIKAERIAKMMERLEEGKKRYEK